MGLEAIEGAGKYISDLDSANPVGTVDTLAEADNHIRGIKNTLKLSFPVITGPLLCTQAELNIFAGAGVTALGTGGSLDADQVDGIHAATTATANMLLALDASAELNCDVNGTLVGNVLGDLTGIADDSDLLATQLPSYYLDADNFTNMPVGSVVTAGSYVMRSGSVTKAVGESDITPKIKKWEYKAKESGSVTIKLTVFNNGPGAIDNRTIGTLYLNGVAEALSITVTADDTTTSATQGLTIVAGDVIEMWMQCDQTNGADNGEGSVTLDIQSAEWGEIYS